MSSPESPTLPTALERYGQIETDYFCSGCGYNLHGQTVSRDERLEIMIVRCPECARFAPAGAGTSATNVWLKRVGANMLALWVLLCIAIFLAALMTLGGMQLAFVEQGTTRGHFTPEGRQVEYGYDRNNATGGGQWVYVDTGEPYGETTQGTDYRRVLKPAAELWWGDTHHPLMHGFTALVSILIGGFAAIACWHAKLRAFILAILVPLLGTVFGLFIWTANSNEGEPLSWVVKHMLLYTVPQIVIAIFGALVGRPIARMLVSTFVSPKARQMLSFLWETDGKILQLKPAIQPQ